MLRSWREYGGNTNAQLEQMVESIKATETGSDACMKVIALAIGEDAGNRSMKAGGRTEWNENDWNAAALAFDRAWDVPKFVS